LKPVGVQLRSSSTPKKVKPFLERMINVIMSTGDKKKSDEEYYKIYKEFKSLTINDLAVSTSIKGLGKYTELAKGFTMAKGTPAHVKAAISYNILLKQLNLTNKYENIKTGNKMKMFYIKPNKFGISAIGFNNEYPQEFEFEIDIDKMFDKLITKEVQRFYDTIKWELTEPERQKNGDIQMLFGY
jgi:hypothetical protein